MTSSSPLISTRVSLGWPPHPPREDTDTLVLTGRSGYFLDLRIVTEGGNAGVIDWATAGLKEWVRASPGEEGDLEHPRASFTALLDSRSPAPVVSSAFQPAEPAAADIGTFVTLASGDVLETGWMANPNSLPPGQVQMYEEVWRRLPVPSPCSVVILERCDGRAWCGRVGDREISLEQAPAGFWAGRWEAGGEIFLVGGAAGRAGLARVPSCVAEQAGEVTELGGREWIVRENS